MTTSGVEAISPSCNHRVIIISIPAPGARAEERKEKTRSSQAKSQPLWLEVPFPPAPARNSDFSQDSDSITSSSVCARWEVVEESGTALLGPGCIAAASDLE